MDRADQSDISKLSTAVESVERELNAGNDPTKAVIKIARANSFNSNWTSRLCEITNRLLAVTQLSNEPGEKRAGEYPTVDPTAVLDVLFPTKIAVKAASVSAIPFERKARYTYNDIQTFEKRADDLTTGVFGKGPLTEPTRSTFEESPVRKMVNSGGGLAKPPSNVPAPTVNAAPAPAPAPQNTTSPAPQSTAFPAPQVATTVQDTPAPAPKIDYTSYINKPPSPSMSANVAVPPSAYMMQTGTAPPTADTAMPKIIADLKQRRESGGKLNNADWGLLADYEEDSKARLDDSESRGADRAPGVVNPAPHPAAPGSQPVPLSGNTQRMNSYLEAQQREERIEALKQESSKALQMRTKQQLSNDPNLRNDTYVAPPQAFTQGLGEVATTDPYTSSPTIVSLGNHSLADWSNTPNQVKNLYVQMDSALKKAPNTKDQEKIKQEYAAKINVFRTAYNQKDPNETIWDEHATNPGAYDAAREKALDERSGGTSGLGKVYPTGATPPSSREVDAKNDLTTAIGSMKHLGVLDGPIEQVTPENINKAKSTIAQYAAALPPTEKGIAPGYENNLEGWLEELHNRGYKAFQDIEAVKQVFGPMISSMSRATPEAKAKTMAVAAAKIKQMSPEASWDADLARVRTNLRAQELILEAKKSQSMQKKSNRYNSNPTEIVKRACAARADYRRDIKDLIHKKADLIENVQAALMKAASEIIDGSHSFKDIEERAKAFYGTEIDGIMTKLAEFVPNATRFEGEPRLFTTNLWNKEPYRATKDVIDTFRKAAVMSDAIETQKKASQKVIDYIDSCLTGINHVKQAAGDGVLQTLTRLSVLGHNALKPGEDGKSDRSNESWQLGLSPGTVNELRSVDVRSALTSALSDPVVSKFPLHEIIHRYNKLAELSPRAVENSALLVPLLRQGLEVPDVSPYDLRQVQDLESIESNRKNIVKNNTPTK